MKAVLMSTQPKWCELIVRAINPVRYSAFKTIEVRKTRPKLETPFKVYIYCTYGEGLIEANDEFLPNHLIGQKVSKNKIWGNCCNGKVVGEFVCNEITVAERGNYCVLKKSETLIDELDLLEYANQKTVYGWHISNLEVYDKPKELSEFRKPVDCPRGIAREDCIGCWDCEITRPPQSWCYVEELSQ